MPNCTLCDDRGWYKEDAAPVTRQCPCVTREKEAPQDAGFQFEVIEGLEYALSVYEEHGLMSGDKGMAQLDAIFNGARAYLKFQQAMKVKN